jgi:hypothetical protein
MTPDPLPPPLPAPVTFDRALLVDTVGRRFALPATVAGDVVDYTVAAVEPSIRRATHAHLTGRLLAVSQELHELARAVRITEVRVDELVAQVGRTDGWGSAQ